MIAQCFQHCENVLHELDGVSVVDTISCVQKLLAWVFFRPQVALSRDGDAEGQVLKNFIRDRVLFFRAGSKRRTDAGSRRVEGFQQVCEVQLIELSMHYGGDAGGGDAGWQVVHLFDLS